MKNLIFTVTIIFSISFIGCKPTKTVTDTTSIIKKDSIVYNIVTKDSTVIKIKEVITPSNNTSINLKNPCDSLGNLKPIDFNTTVGKSKLKIIFKDNEIKIEAINDSIKSIYESKLVYKEKSKDSIIKSLKIENRELIQKTTKTKFNWWFVFSIGLNLIFAYLLLNRITRIL